MHGKYAEARALAAKTLQQALDTIGPRHPLALLAMGNYASALNALGEYDGGAAISRAGPEDQHTGIRRKASTHDRGDAATMPPFCWGGAAPAEALPLFERALAHHTEAVW